MDIPANNNPGEVYVPSDDGMSDILNNAGNAYALYLDYDGKDDKMPIDPGQAVFCYLLHAKIG